MDKEDKITIAFIVVFTLLLISIPVIQIKIITLESKMKDEIKAGKP